MLLSFLLHNTKKLPGTIGEGRSGQFWQYMEKNFLQHFHGQSLAGEVLVLRYMLDDPAHSNTAQGLTSEAMTVKML